jgi:hypothetical protein
MYHANYGAINRPEGASRIELPIKASVAFKALGGKFVSKDGTDDFKLAVAADTEIMAWCDVNGDVTTPAAITKYSCLDDLDYIYVLPAGATFTEAEAIALLYKTCDLKDTNTAGTSVQSVNQAASSTDVIVIVGYDVDAQTFYVKINPAKRYATGAA